MKLYLRLFLIIICLILCFISFFVPWGFFSDHIEPMTNCTIHENTKGFLWGDFCDKDWSYWYYLEYPRNFTIPSAFIYTRPLIVVMFCLLFIAILFEMKVPSLVEVTLVTYIFFSYLVLTIFDNICEQNKYVHPEIFYHQGAGYILTMLQSTITTGLILYELIKF